MKKDEKIKEIEQDIETSQELAQETKKEEQSYYDLYGKIWIAGWKEGWNDAWETQVKERTMKAIERGSFRAKSEIARELLKRDYNEYGVAHYTSLPYDEIEKLMDKSD